MTSHNGAAVLPPDALQTHAGAHVQDGRRILWGVDPSRSHDPAYVAAVLDLHARLMPTASPSDMHVLIDETTGTHTLRSTTWYDPTTGAYLGGHPTWHEVTLPDSEHLP